MGKAALVLLRALAWLYYLAPRFARGALGSGLGAVLRALGLRAPVVRQNLELAYPGELPEAVAARSRYLKAAYSHLGKLALEVLLLFGPFDQFVRSQSVLKGVEHWKAARERGRGVLFLSSHVGNWEVMAATGAVHGGMDLMLVTKRLKPDWFHDAFQEGRLRCGVKATYEPKTLRDVLGQLKRNGTVGFVLDQYAGPPVGVRVPVFGTPVSTSMALATLAKRTGAAVLPVVNHRLADGGFEVEIEPALEWSPHEDAAYELALNTARYAAVLEGHIRRYPGQWLWTHRRFKGDLSPLRENEWYQGRARG